MRAAIDNLMEIYVLSRDELLNEVLNGRAVGTKVFANTLLRSLQKQIKKLKKASDEYIKAEIPKAYRKALKELYSEYANALRMQKPNLFAMIHTEAIETAALEMQYQISSGIEQAGRRAQRYIDAAKDEVLRQEGLRSTGVKFGSGQTVEMMKESLKKSLSDKGFLTVQYGSGPKAYQVGLDSYARMVARTTTKEVGNLARINGLIETGHDLVKMTEHYPTCGLCATLQGRVYSISGKDKRFPPLSSAFPSGYKTVHPNCRHIVTPWIESLQSPEEIKEAIAFSNRPFDDSRDKKEIDLYNSQQAKSREYRETLGQYERYKNQLGKFAPDSLKSFRSIKNEDGKRWRVLQAQYKGMGYYNKALANEPDLTKQILSVSKKLKFDAVGLDSRIKTKESYLGKIAKNYRESGNKFEINDIIRYTYASDSSDLAEKTIEAIEEHNYGGYNTIRLKNTWGSTSNPYRGINTFVRAPNGQKFEVQYHTPESFALKNGELHDLYKKADAIEDKESKEYIDLQDLMFKLSDILEEPTGIRGIKNI